MGLQDLWIPLLNFIGVPLPLHPAEHVAGIQFVARRLRQNTEQHTDARRVGILRYVDNGGSQYEYIGDSIYDKGY